MGIKRRNQNPESSFWDTAAGAQWLARLVFGIVYYFGIKQGVGAESLSEFIRAVHLDTHVASSASALRQLKQRMNQAVIDYEGAQAEHCVPSEGQGICVGADETFFGLPGAGAARTEQWVHLYRKRMRESHLRHLDGTSKPVVAGQLLAVSLSGQ